MISGLTPQDIGLPPKFSHWRPSQSLAIDRGLSSQKRFIAHSMPTGEGKSVMYVAHAILEAKRACILTSSKGLQNQLLSDFAPCGMVDIRGRNNYQCVIPECRNCEEGQHHRCAPIDCGYEEGRNTALSSPLVVTNYTYFMLSYLYGRGLGDFDMLILDECFVAGTLVDGRPIERIQIGDSVSAFDVDAGRMLTKKVTRTFCNKAPTSLLKINFSDGASVVCTENHPFWTSDGWKIAALLSDSDWCLKNEKNTLPGPDTHDLCKPKVSEALGACRSKEEIRISEVQPGCMQSRMWSRTSKTSGTDAGAETGIERTYEAVQSYALVGYQKEDDKNSPGYGTQTLDAGRQWERRDTSTKVTGGGAGPAYRDCDIDQTENRRVSNQLQIGHRGSGAKAGDRGGWVQSSITSETRTGPKERDAVRWVRVDSVEVYQSSDPERFREVCPDGKVYNFEVEDLHTYTANGIIVHNCHSAPDEVCSALTIEIAYWEATKIGIRLPGDDSELKDWWEWGQEVLLKAERMLVELKEEARSDKEESGKVHPSTAKDLSFWAKIEAKAKAIINTQNTGRWITERTKEGRKLEPVWARDHAHKILFRNFPRIVLTSATMVLKTIDLMGIPRDECDFFEYPSSFPVRRSPVYLWGAAKISSKSKINDFVLWQARTNNIIRKRMDRKGIIHSVSYDRAKYIFNNADIEAGPYMLVPESGRDTAAAIEQFKAMPPPGILISPAITTGYDFPGPECEYNIIAKVPFLDTRNKVIAARQEEDPDYGAYVTAQIIQQAHGRSMRGEWDQSETFITDSNIYWFIRDFRTLFAFWFHRLIVYPKTMPEPPAPLKAVLPTLNSQGSAAPGLHLVKK